jgi:hypothetical protein
VAHPFPLHRGQGNPSGDFPDPMQERQTVSISQLTTPFPPQTMHESLAPSGFLPEPEQNRHFFTGSFTVTLPVPLHTRHPESSESKSYGSFPVPLQNAHLITLSMTLILID